MQKIIITKTVEEVIEDPQQVLTNLQKTLKDIAKDRERLNNLEKEILWNIELIWSHIGAFIVQVTEWWKKAISREIWSWIIGFDVTRGDQIAFNNIDADHICQATMNEREMKKEAENSKAEEADTEAIEEVEQ